jgi:predicted transcriptional regulator
MAGVSQSLISKVENGQLVPNYDVALRIIRALELVREKEGLSRAREIMSSPVISVSPKDSLRKAISLMEEHGISQLPVISNGKGCRFIDGGSDNKQDRLYIDGDASGGSHGEPIPNIPPGYFCRSDKEVLLYYQAVLIQENGLVIGDSHEVRSREELGEDLMIKYMIIASAIEKAISKAG